MSVVIVIILKGMNLLFEFGVSILTLACFYDFPIVWNCSDSVGLIYCVNYMNFQHFIPHKFENVLLFFIRNIASYIFGT